MPQKLWFLCKMAEFWNFFKFMFTFLKIFRKIAVIFIFALSIFYIPTAKINI